MLDLISLSRRRRTGGSPAPEPEGPDLIYASDFSAGVESQYRGRWRWQTLGKWFNDYASNWTTMGNWEVPALAHLNPFSVSGGVARIRTFLTPAEDVATIEANLYQEGADAGSWIGGLLFTKDYWKYGWWQWRGRYPNPGNGMWPGKWTYSPHVLGTTKNLEVDLIEIFGEGDGKKWEAHIHFRMNEGNVEVRAPIKFGPFDYDTTGYHTWSMEWRGADHPDGALIRIFYDDYVIGEITGEWAEWYDEPMEMRDGIGAGADWFPASGHPNPDGSTPSPMYADIEYHKIWSYRPPYTEAPTEAPVITVTGGSGEFLIEMDHEDYVARGVKYRLQVADTDSEDDEDWSEVTDYFWRERTEGSESLIDRSFIDDGYGDGVLKFYRLRAENEAGNGPWSVAVSDTTTEISGNIAPEDWGSNLAAWHGSNLPAAWALSGGEMVVTGDGWNEDNILLASPALVGAWDITIDCVLGAGGASIDLNGGGGAAPSNFSLLNGTHTYQQTISGWSADKLHLVVQSDGFRLKSVTITPAV